MVWKLKDFEKFCVRHFCLIFSQIISKWWSTWIDREHLPLSTQIVNSLVEYVRVWLKHTGDNSKPSSCSIEISNICYQVFILKLISCYSDIDSIKTCWLQSFVKIRQTKAICKLRRKKFNFFMFLEYCLDWVYILQQATLKNCHRWAVEEMYKLVYMWLTIGYLSLLISVIWQNALLYCKTLEK